MTGGETVKRHCLLCGSGELAPIIDVGPQPVANRFLRAPDDPEEQFPIALQQCHACGLVQIEQPVPARALIPPYDWITYNEPEDHLDRLVDILVGLPGIEPGAVAGGLSFKDDSTLARLGRKGLRTWRLDLQGDLAVAGGARSHGVETVQDRLTPQRADEIARRRGRADLLLVRHILEHSARPLDFLDALRRLTTPHGYIVVEVPDCSRALEGGDYTTIWEEHTLYYTPETFRQGFAAAGLQTVRLEDYPYPFENSLVAIARSNGSGGPLSRPSPAVIECERRRAAAFGTGFPSRRDGVRRHLDEHRGHGGRIALFGAGHLACMWLSVFGVADLIEFVVDDNPHKRGLFMPGSRLPILGSGALIDRGITLCLLSLNPIGEAKVIAQHQAFIDRGGTFASIFPASARAVST